MAPSTVRGGPFSPSMSSAASFSSSYAQSKLNIVSRLAIEGKAKQGSDGASVKLYLKLTIPVDSVTPGQTIPLFAEENVKIRTDQVHPLDSDSAPYVFSSGVSPLLHNAARALNLPARSSKSYLSLFENAPHMSPARNGSAGTSTVPPLEERYTGYFLISGYNVCYVLPKEFPQKGKVRMNGTDSESDALGRNTPRSPYRRRSSISERNTIQFMAALDLWVPLSSKPPKAPYLLSIPIPRCLSNYIKLRLPSPGSVSTSFASLSSDEDSGGWDVVTEPHVTRGAKPGSRSGAYNDFADDESSEASAVGVSENCLVHGTFTSSDSIRIRWASPMASTDFSDQSEGRRRVNIADVKGNMTCTVLGMVEDGVKMRLDYQGTCSGLWFPGVATMLGMDVILDAQGCDVLWASDGDGLWVIDGDTPYTGSSLDAHREAMKRQNQFEIPQLSINNETQDMSGFMNGETLPGGRLPSTHSASLLRAPLPSRKISNDYSFENSVTPSTSGLPSSVPSMSTSLTRSSVNGSNEINGQNVIAPTGLFTLHLNLSDVLSSPKNKFTFNISGTVIVYRKDELEEDSQTLSVSLPFPMFRVYQAEKQSISQTVRSQCDQANVELDSVTASYTSSKGTRTVVPYGSQIRCPYEDSVIVVRPLPQQLSGIKSEEPTSSMIYSRGSSGLPPTRSNSPAKTSIQLDPGPPPNSVIYDGPSIIPWAKIEVVPLVLPDAEWSYAVTLTFPASGALSSDKLEFALPHPPESDSSSSTSPVIEVVTASIDGIPVNVEKFPSEKADSLTMSVDGLTKPSKATWLSWIKVRTSLNGQLELVYTVKEGERRNSLDVKGKKRVGDVAILLPAFSLPVGRLDVEIRRASDTSSEPDSSRTSDLHLYRKVTRINLQPSSRIDLSVPRHLFSRSQHSSPSLLLKQRNTQTIVTWAVLPLMLIAYIMYLTRHIVLLREDIQQLKTGMPENWSLLLNEAILSPPKIDVAHHTTTVTSTTTLISCSATPSPSEKHWFAHTVTVSVPTSTSNDSGKSRATQAQVHDTEDFDLNCDDSEEEGCGSLNNGRDDDVKRRYGLTDVPAIRLPALWPFHDRMENAKASARKGWKRVWHIVEIIINWPLPVEPSDDL